jgi:hypothetical protein
MRAIMLWLLEEIKEANQPGTGTGAGKAAGWSAAKDSIRLSLTGTVPSGLADPDVDVGTSSQSGLASALSIKKDSKKGGGRSK